MGFRENLLQKIKINQLADQVLRSLKPADPPQRIDRAAMQSLLEMSRYTHLNERDLDLFIAAENQDKSDILVLDNELKIYHTTIEDVALRKSPTVKEMISIRNAIKILNDKDVVISSKGDSLRHITDELLDHLDLTYTLDDLNAMEQDGRVALKNSYADGILEMAMLFCELLDFEKVPKPFRHRHQQIWGEVLNQADGVVAMGSILLFDQMHNTLKLVLRPIKTTDKEAMYQYELVAKSEAKADVEGEAVFTELKKRAWAKTNEGTAKGNQS